MNEYRYGAPADEKPLDRLITDGGYASIFRSIACIGDSLSSGEFETFDQSTGNRGYYDMYDYSWGQFLGRMTGARVYNFSRGGMTASEYCESYAQERGWWDPSLRSQAYIIALGLNDLINYTQPLGDMSDINPDDPAQNKKTFTGYYARIIAQYKRIQPDAKFFLVSMPLQDDYIKNDEERLVAKAHADRLHELAAYFENTYVIDLYRYAPRRGEDFIKRFCLFGHLNVMGYRLTAEQIGSYIDYIIRHNPDEFVNVPFITTEIPFKR